MMINPRYARRPDTMRTGCSAAPIAGIIFVLVSLGCRPSEKSAELSKSCGDSQAVLKAFCTALREAKTYRVTVSEISRMDNNPTTFHSDGEYDIAVVKPNLARLWPKRGVVSGPALLSDGKRVLFSKFPARKADVATTAPATLSEVAWNGSIGEKNTAYLKHSTYVIGGLLNLEPCEALNGQFGAPTSSQVETILGVMCCRLHFDTPYRSADMWFEANAPHLLRQVIVKGKDKGRGLTVTQVYADWVLNQAVPQSVFNLVDPFTGKEP